MFRTISSFFAASIVVTITFFTAVSQIANAADVHQGKVQIRQYTKGAVGQTAWVRHDSSEARRARAIESRPARAAHIAATSAPDDASLCRPLRVYNLKGAKSYLAPKGQHLIRCAGVNGQADKGASYCTADLPCAKGSVCDMKMACAKVA